MAKVKYDLLWWLGSPEGRRALRLRLIHTFMPALMPLGTVLRKTALQRRRVVAVTGSAGKSTTTRALAAVLGQSKPSVSNVGSYVAWRLIQQGWTSDWLVQEVGLAGPGEMRPIASMLVPDVVVITSIGHDHIESFTELSRTAFEKGELLALQRPCGLAILNADDPVVLSMASRTPAPVVRVGSAACADVRCLQRTVTQAGTELVVEVDGRQLKLRTRLLGRVGVFPILAGIALARWAGIPLATAGKRLEAIEPIPGRLQPLKTGLGITLVQDTYKTPVESFPAALEALQEMPAIRHIAVLGHIASVRGKASYRALAEHVDGLDALYFYGDRRKGKALRGALENRVPMQLLPPDFREAAVQLRSALRPGDVVLVKGRQSHWFDRLIRLLRGKDVQCLLEDCPLQTVCGRCSMVGLKI